jgi:hypothetical protein
MVKLTEDIMALPSMTLFGAVFLSVFILILWLKYREHLHAHRHENGPHGDRTHPHHAHRWRH